MLGRFGSFFGLSDGILHGIERLGVNGYLFGRKRRRGNGFRSRLGGGESRLSATESALHGFVHGAENRAENGVSVPETHLGFGGMNIDIHLVERHKNVQHEHRICALYEKILVCFFSRGSHRFTFDHAAVDNGGLTRAGRRRIIHLGYITAHRHARRRDSVDGDESPRVKRGINGSDCVDETAAFVLHYHAVFVGESQSQCGICQRDFFHRFADIRLFGGRFF